ncbi:MAG: DUF6799 domain-containing protein [Reichenbachiella sp.]|uniref:DUF6799 domain-containing protein n=1 Tax=Reichenbachiella sp. TaxID=2184521 RepID=UPI0032638B8A
MKKMVLVIIGLFLGIGALIAQDQQQARKRIHQQDHILYQDGKMMQMKAGVTTQMQESYTFQNGTIVNPDGTYRLKNGKTKKLRNGECINNDGVRFRSQQKMMNKSQPRMNQRNMNKQNPGFPKGKSRRSRRNR